MRAPIVVAKGADLIALQIREIAAEHHVPVVEAPPLARALHASCELGDEIPAQPVRRGRAGADLCVPVARRAQRGRLAPTAAAADASISPPTLIA